jgi:hypothetical protein
MDSVSIALEWCPDGAELVDRGPPYGYRTKNSRGDSVSLSDSDADTAFGEWIRYRSNRREVHTLRMGRSSSPLALQFVNASKMELIGFIGEHGAPVPPHSPDGDLPLEDILTNQTVLRSALKSFQDGDLRPAIDIFQIYSDYFTDLKPQLEIKGNKPILTLIARNLYGFMALEIASIVTGGSMVNACLNCAQLFVSGRADGKRRGALYCSNRCRVAHQRVRERAKETSGRSVA